LRGFETDPSRGGAHGVAVLGFRFDGETGIQGTRFVRYRLRASTWQ